MADRSANRFLRRWRYFRSLAAKIIILLTIFIACPAIIYVEMRAADAEKNALILQIIQNQGHLIARSLAPLLRRTGEAGAPDLQDELQRLSIANLRVKVLFRRADAARSNSYLYIASLPPLSGAYLAQEFKEILSRKILNKLGDTCAGYKPLAIHFTNPAGETEFLSSMTPIHTEAGCWVVLTSYPPGGIAGIAIGQPYWKRAEVQLAAGIYIVMAILVVFLFLSIWRSLQRFSTLAQTIRQHADAEGSFADSNRVPELEDVAREFDLMVDSLSKSQKAMQAAAEENAHAFKTPIAVIAQSVEPLKRAVAADDKGAKRAIELIERSVDRLDSLVGAARRMDHTMADLVNPPRDRIDFSRLVNQMVESYKETAHLRDITLNHRVSPGIHVLAGEDLLETVIENVLDNGLDHAPRNSAIAVELARSRDNAVLTVTDQGPGVDPRNLERLFDRYFSHRPDKTGEGDRTNQENHFGIGLWIVRRNLEAVGGEVVASNSADGNGLRMTIRLPLTP